MLKLIRNLRLTENIYPMWALPTFLLGVAYVSTKRAFVTRAEDALVYEYLQRVSDNIKYQVDSYCSLRRYFGYTSGLNLSTLVYRGITLSPCYTFVTISVLHRRFCFG